jgi:hypothetical protein
MIAALLTFAGVAGTFFVARSISRSDAQRSHQAFTHASGQVASTLRLAIAREQDLVVGAGAFELENPHASSADFTRWTREERAFARYPELEGVAAIAFVRRSRLPAFEAHAQADPVGPGGVFSIVPAGARPYYCFVALTQGRDGVSRASTDVDFCASNPQLIGSRTSGRGYDSPIIVPALGKTPLLGIETPLYRGGTVPRTVSGRRAAFLGWTAIVVVPQVLLDSALRGVQGRSCSP